MTVQGTNGKKEQSSHYSYALHYKWLTRFYDPVVRWTCRESTFKRALIAQARIEPGMGILDVGCGTGTLTVLLKQTHPEADVVGLDGSEGDPRHRKVEGRERRGGRLFRPGPFLRAAVGCGRVRPGLHQLLLPSPHRGG